MSTKLQLFLILWLGSYLSVQAQGSLHGLSARWKKRSKSEQLLGFDGGFESKSSFIRFQPVSLHAVKGGVSFRERIYFYLGYHWLSTPVYNLVKKKLPDGRDTLISGKLHLNYFSQSLEFVCFRNDYWRFSVPVLVGIGVKRYSDRNIAPGSQGKLSGGRFVPFEVAISTTYKAFPWLGVGGSVGYRTSLLQPLGPLGQDYRGITYSMGFSVYLRPLYRALTSFQKETPGKKPVKKPSR